MATIQHLYKIQHVCNHVKKVNKYRKVSSGTESYSILAIAGPGFYNYMPYVTRRSVNIACGPTTDYTR